MRRSLTALATATCLATGAGATAARATNHADPEIMAACRDAVLRLSPTAARAAPWRTVLGTVSMPPAYIGQTVAYKVDGWSYWSKWGINIGAGSPAVRISVPEAYRKQVAIEWGLGGPVSAQRFAPCSHPPTYWSGYAGGFHLKNRSACIPLRIQVGTETRTLHFGIGRRCP